MASGVAQRPHVPSCSIPDLSDKIIRFSDHPTEAGGFADVYKCQYKSNEGIKDVSAVSSSQPCRVLIPESR